MIAEAAKTADVAELEEEECPEAMPDLEEWPEAVMDLEEEWPDALVDLEEWESADSVADCDEESDDVVSVAFER